MAAPAFPDIVPASNALQAKLGGPMGAAPVLLARAEAALDALSAHFGPWLAEEIGHLLAARARALRAEGPSTLPAKTSACAPMRVKSLGATFSDFR